MVATVLDAGGAAIIGYNSGVSDGTGNPPTTDKIHVVLLQGIGSGTVLRFTDRTWNGTAFSSSGSDGTITFTAAADIAAGTVITISVSGANATITINGVNSVVPANGFNFAGNDNGEAAEAIYIYQGAADAPTNFVYAGEFADGNTTFNASLANTGLIAGVTASAIAFDSGAYHGPTTHAASFLHNGAASTLLHSIADSTNWSGDDDDGQNTIEQQVQTGPWLRHADVDFYGTAAGAGGAIVKTSGDATVGGGSDDFNHAELYHALLVNGTNVFFSLRDLTFDTVDGRFFVVDSDITGGHNRILQGNISDLLGNPGTPPTLTVLYTDTGVTTASRLDNFEVDIVNNIVYFTHGSELIKVNYNTANQPGTVLFNANVGGGLNPAGATNNFFTDMAINFVTGEVYLSSKRVLASAGGDSVTKNHIYQLTGLTPGSGAGAFTMNGAANTGNARLLPFAENDLAFNPTGGTPAGSPFSSAADPYAFPLERGTLDGLAIDPVTNRLYFSTGEILFDHDGSSGTPPQYAGGVIGFYALGANTANGQGAVTILHQQTAQFGGAIPGLIDDIEIDTVAGKYYVLDVNGVNGVNDDHHIYQGNLSGAGTPVQFSQEIGNINGLTQVGFAINHAPTLAATPLAGFVTEASSAPNSGQTSAVSLFGSVVIGDVDTGPGDEISGAVVRISTNFQSGVTHQDLLLLGGAQSGTTASGISFTYNQSTGALVLTGAATAAEYAAAIQQVTFATSGDNITNFGFATTRGISVSVSDGLTLSDEINTTVVLTGINDAPVNAPGGQVNATEDGGSMAITGITVSDVDADPATQEITVTLSVPLGTLALQDSVPGGLVAAQITGNLTDTVVVTGTQNQINATLAAASGVLLFFAGNINGDVALTIVTNDDGFNGNDPGLTGGGVSEADTDIKTIFITPVNDAPTVAGDGTEDAPTIDEDDPVGAETVAILFGGQFADTTDDQTAFVNGSASNIFAGVAVIGNGSSAGTGQWQYFDTNTASFVNIGPANIASAQLFSADAVLRFNPAPNFNGTAPTLTVLLIETGGPAIVEGQNADLSGPGAFGGTSRFSNGIVTLNQFVVAVNDAPVLGDPTQAEVIAPNSGDPVAILQGASVSDVDGLLTGGSFTVSVSDTGGAIDLRNGSGFSIVGSDVIEDGTGNVVASIAGTGTTAVSVSGLTASATPAAINALLAAFAYSGSGTAQGNRTATLVFNDGANGGPGALTDSVTQSLLVTFLEGTDAGETITGTPQDDLIFAEGGADDISGNDGNDRISSGTGDDTARGGNGNDGIYGGLGTDLLEGNDGNDTLDGSEGDDEMNGGTGNDNFHVRDAGDVVIESIEGGTDRVLSHINSYTLAFGVETLQFVGTGDFTGTGNDFDNVIFGRNGNDTLDGGLGADLMGGGLGDDLYFVDNAGDRVQEAANQGTDTVRTSLGRQSLAFGVENLIYTGVETFSGTGNELANEITGGGNADTLNGNDGNDRLLGGGGNDSLHGGTGADFIDGEAGNDVIDGGAGDDEMRGGIGNDDFYVRDAGDVVVENAAAGIDRALVAIASYTLTANVENLQFVGTGAFTGTGNGLANSVSGGAGDDVLDGAGGNDFLIGGAGSDRLIGGAGSDSFVFQQNAAGTGTDTIALLSRAEGDRIDLRAIDANSTGGAPGDQAFVFIGAAAFGGVAGQLRAEAGAGTSYTISGDLDGDGTADFTIVVEQTTQPIGAGDFLL